MTTPYTRFLPSRPKATVSLSNATTTGCNSTSVRGSESTLLNSNTNAASRWPCSRANDEQVPFPSAPISIEFPAFEPLRLDIPAFEPLNIELPKVPHFELDAPIPANPNAACDNGSKIAQFDAAFDENSPSATLPRVSSTADLAHARPRAAPRRKRTCSASLPAMHPAALNGPFHYAPGATKPSFYIPGNGSRKHTSAPAPRPSVKRRKTKRATADMQFAALVHRSVVASIAQAAQAMDVDGGEEGKEKEVKGKVALKGQDLELTRRLWRNLAEGGCEPTLFIPVPTLQSASSGPSTPIIAPTIPPGLEPEPMDVDTPPTPNSSPTNSPTTSPVTSPIMTPSQCPPTPPSTPAPQPTLSLPQLVATLILRHHARTNSRPRPRGERAGGSAGSLRGGYTFPELRRPGTSRGPGTGTMGMGKGRGSPLAWHSS
ncbi:hypothetical protein HWV62_4391 [Athelia sp. TMB]|nr:hypothetical protein HWV62_4391 [Athelia sp. TMB]